jgi:hypothetical protein
MKVSIIISILNSHEILKRHLLHFKEMNLPDDVEFIFLDDGSYPSLKNTVGLKNVMIYPTNDDRPWAVGLARNLGAELAMGDYYLMTDIDYIISREAVETVRNFTGHKLRFKRQFGILDEEGSFTQDFDELRKWGLLESRIQERGLNLPPHPNNFAMRKDIYWMLGGYDESKMHLPYPKCTDDGGFKGRWSGALKEGKVREETADTRPTLYMFPSGQFCGDVDYNPFGFFHNLSRKNEANYWYVKSVSDKAAQSVSN